MFLEEQLVHPCNNYESTEIRTRLLSLMMTPPIGDNVLCTGTTENPHSVYIPSHFVMKINIISLSIQLTSFPFSQNSGRFASLNT